MNSGASDPVLVGIDWGTSSLRAFLIDGQGRVLDQVSSPEGIMQVKDGDFDAVFSRRVGPWLVDKPLAILMSGMITSRNGWVETPYADLPLDAAGLARALVPFTTAQGVEVRFITGAMRQSPSGPDVMRGEETQIIGATAQGGPEGLFVMPGTHSKWVRVAQGRLQTFATYMTGEVFAALKDHTILGKFVEDGPFSAEGFGRGVAAGLETGQRLLHHVFMARTLPLMGDLPPAMVADYLSGLLIGSEVAAEAKGRDRAEPIRIVGRSDLADRYERALEQAGLTSLRAPEDCVAKGHFLIAQSAGLVP